ncbi:helix-turn-helix domain-containing protein [Nocardiopsis halotolerans]|uniref:helix-turn-helix domain-containing protein n=1 Tax=Nocardiopsis halotolerans TaxID=124252 RepID=UPI000345C1D4|nr:MerR family transcriptional regulator [Nocardiopsis halotolerans]
MKSSDAELSIGELAEPFGLATHVLRHWESAGVLEPARRSGGQRRYTHEHRLRVALVLRAQEAGFSLAQIREMTGAPDGAERRARLAEHLARLDERLEKLRAARELVSHAMACDADDILECPRMRAVLEESGTSECVGRPGRTYPPSSRERPCSPTT